MNKIINKIEFEAIKIAKNHLLEIKEFYEKKQNKIYELIRTAERGVIDEYAETLLTINKNIEQIEIKEKEIEKSIKEKEENNNASNIIA